MTQLEPTEAELINSIRETPLLCPACGQTSGKQSLRPYCSAICRLLAERGLGWRTDPYRIVDQVSGVTVKTGPEFNLTSEGIADLQKKAELLRQPASEVTLAPSTASLPTPVSPQGPQAEVLFAGNNLS